jgi:hypothetical protein
VLRARRWPGACKRSRRDRAASCHLIDENFGAEPVVMTAERIRRSPNADIRFEEPTVSRRHALILRQGAEGGVVDNRSSNGVYLGGERVDSSGLGDGEA